jgi:Xaa-Pro aminopeptidase
MDSHEYARRRRALMRMMGDDAIALVPASPHAVRNRDVEYPYRQDADLMYLTGFPEPDAIAAICPGRDQGEFVLFCRERDPDREVWHGPRAGLEGAVERFGADDAFPISDVDEILPGIIEGCSRIYCSMGRYAAFDRRVMDWVNEVRSHMRSGAHAPHEFISLDYILHDMRLYKSRDEVRAMQRAARISMAAHERAIQACRPGLHEYELEAAFWHEFRRNNAEPAYGIIVGGGANGCVLHYVNNDAVLNDGDLVLIDAGCECDGYAADITRTFPINGRFSASQRQVYEIVLNAQKAALAEVRPGAHWNDPHDTAVRVITAGLIELGLLSGDRDARIEDGSYKRFFMHRVGHWLGMDVHDVGDYKVDGGWRELEAGMCLTIEPGLYIPPSADIPEHLRGMGVRIEDDVHVTKTGADVLTSDLAKEIDDIEDLMQRQR